MHHHQPIFHLIPHTHHKPPAIYPSNSNKSHTTFRFPLLALSLSCECGVPTLHFPKPLQSCIVGHFSPPTLLVPTGSHENTSQPTPIFSTHLQPPPKVLCPTCGRQFTSRRLAHHQHSYQTSNSSTPNPCDHFGSIPFLTPTPLTSTWTWVSTLDVLKSFNLGFCRFQLYNRIPIALQRDVQMAFRLPLDKLTHDLYNVVNWHLPFLLPQWCFVLPLHG